MSAVLLEREEELAIIRLNRPEVLNAINVPLLEQLLAILHATRAVPVRIIEGAGRGFCAGEDLKQTLAPETGGADELRVAFEQLQDITRNLTAGGPVIAAVHGVAVGGGAELALAADFVLVGPEARFRFPEVGLGHAATGGITGRLAALIGLGRAKELLLTSKWVDAGRAVELGFANELVEDPNARARELASELSDKPRRSLVATKRAIELAAQANQEAVLQAEVDVAAHCFGAQEATSSMERFRQGERW